MKDTGIGLAMIFMLILLFGAFLYGDIRTEVYEGIVVDLVETDGDYIPVYAKDDSRGKYLIYFEYFTKNGDVRRFQYSVPRDYFESVTVGATVRFTRFFDSSKTAVNYSMELLEQAEVDCVKE